MRPTLPRAACALSLALLTTAPLHATVLTFDNGNTTTPTLCTADVGGTGPLTACSAGSSLSQSYGDQAGRIDVRYAMPRVATPRSLLWWSTGYDDLFGVLWAIGDDSNSAARIDLVPLAAGEGVRLNGFDLGAFANATVPTTVEVRDLLTDALLWTFSGDIGDLPANQHESFAPDVFSANGLRLLWRDSAFNVGLDNLDFSLERAVVNDVPEPAGAVWWVAAAALAATWRRRRMP